MNNIPPPPERCSVKLPASMQSASDPHKISDAALSQLIAMQGDEFDMFLSGFGMAEAALKETGKLRNKRAAAHLEKVLEFVVKKVLLSKGLEKQNGQ